MKCKKCENDFEPKKGLKNYCSLQCRNSRTWTDEDKEKKSISAKNSEKVKKILEKLQSKELVAKASETRRKKYLKKLMEEPFENLSFDRLRKRILLEQNGKCSRCHIDNWLGEPITLEVDHINGDNSDNSRGNLEALCPNCHSLTDTWRGRNKKCKRKERVSDEIILNALVDKNFNMRQALLSVGLAAKGGNYNRCHKILRECAEVYDKSRDVIIRSE